MANRSRIKRISKEMDELISAINRKINTKFNGRARGVSYTDTSRYLAELIKERGGVILKKKRGKKGIELKMPFNLWDEVQ